MKKLINLQDNTQYKSIIIDTILLSNILEMIKKEFCIKQKKEKIIRTKSLFEEELKKINNFSTKYNNEEYQNIKLLSSKRINYMEAFKQYHEYEYKFEYDYLYYPKIINYLNILINSNDDNELNEAYRSFVMFRMLLCSAIEGNRDAIERRRKWKLVNTLKQNDDLNKYADHYPSARNISFNSPSLNSYSIEEQKQLLLIYKQIEGSFIYEELNTKKIVLLKNLF